MTAKTYDTKCYELAEHFLSDEPEINDESNRRDLAAFIQTAIEDWITDAQAPTPLKTADGTTR